MTAERIARAGRHPERRPAARGRRRTRRPTSCSASTTAQAGRELMRRLSAVVASAADPTSPLARHLGERRAHLPGPEGAGRAAGLARQLRLGVPAGDGRAREGARRHRREQPRALGSAARHAGRPRRARRRSRPTARSSRRRSTRARQAYETLPGDHGDLAAGLPRAAHRDGAVRVPGRHQPSGHRRQRHPRHQPARDAAQGRRVRAGLPRRDGRRPADAAARGPGPQRHLRRLPQAAPARGGVPPVPEGRTPRAPRTRSCWRRR